MDISTDLIPAQKTGSKSGATASRKVASAKEAVGVFKKASARLLNINNWHRLCDNRGAEFQLTDEKGQPIVTPWLETGNLIRIRLPAPPNQEGDGYDWVRVEKIQHDVSPAGDEQVCGFRVRPVKNPLDGSAGSAHFYTSDATSSFLICRKGRVIYAMERGRNETPNARGRFLNKVRNLLVAIPAMLGFAKPQWKMLVNGILRSPM